MALVRCMQLLWPFLVAKAATRSRSHGLGIRGFRGLGFEGLGV